MTNYSLYSGYDEMGAYQGGIEMTIEELFSGNPKEALERTERAIQVIRAQLVKLENFAATLRQLEKAASELSTVNRIVDQAEELDKQSAVGPAPNYAEMTVPKATIEFLKSIYPQEADANQIIDALSTGGKQIGGKSQRETLYATLMGARKKATTAGKHSEIEKVRGNVWRYNP